MRAVSSALGLVLVGVGCRAFTDPPLDLCGNRVVEAGEDCDDPDDPACGPASVAAACRYVCEPDEVGAGCATGRVCGEDGICRAPAGSFAGETIVIEEAGARVIEIGDLDGDGRADLIVPTVEVDSTDVKVIYLDAGAAPVVVTLIESIVAVVAVGDLSGDGLADIVMVPESEMFPPEGASTRLSLWTGRADRTLAFGHFATLRSGGRDGRLLAPVSAPDRVLELVTPTLTRRWSSQDVEAQEVPAVGAGGPSLGAAIAIADLDGGMCASDDGADVPMPEVAFASLADVAVRLISTCGGGGEFAALSPVLLPPGRRLGGAGAFFAVADADPHVDLLAQDEAGAVWLAHGVGDRSFHGSTPVPIAAGDGRFDATPLVPASVGVGELLAAADYDDDGRLELVTRDAYLPEPELCSADTCEQKPWPAPLLHAATVDLNGDGALDLATTQEDTLTVFLGGPVNPQDFEAHAQEFRGPLGEVVVGDLNRDTIEDIAFIEVDEDVSDGASEWIVVQYGGVTGAVERFGPFVTIEALVVERGVTIVARVIDEEGRAAGAFVRPGFGEHDFGLVARNPVIVSVDPPTGPGLAVMAVAVPSGESREVLAGLGFAGGTLSPHDVSVGDALALAGGGGLHAVTAAIDVDGDAVDEVLVLGRGQGGEGGVWLAGLDEGGGRWRVREAFAYGPGFARQPNDRFDAPGPAGGGPGSDVAVGDVDGDGDLDAIATTDAPRPAVVVFRNEGGTLTLAGAHTLSGPEAFEVARIKRWHADEAGVARWLVAGADGVGVATIDLEAASIAVELQFEEPTQAIAVGDVDGDGLLDLIQATEEEILVRIADEQIGPAGAEP